MNDADRYQPNYFKSNPTTTDSFEAKLNQWIPKIQAKADLYLDTTSPPAKAGGNYIENQNELPLASASGGNEYGRSALAKLFESNLLFHIQEINDCFL